MGRMKAANKLDQPLATVPYTMPKTMSPVNVLENIPQRMKVAVDAESVVMAASSQGLSLSERKPRAKRLTTAKPLRAVKRGHEKRTKKCNVQEWI